MPNYRYKVMNQNGERLEGTYTANTKEDVMAMIRTNNYYPLKIEEIVEGTKIELNSFTKVKVKDIAIFCRQFYTMLNAGATITRCLNVLGQQVPNKKLRESIVQIDESVRKGLTLSQAMKKEERVFPELLTNMVEAGEVSGNLDLIMLRMATHYEKENKLNNKIRGAMNYPIILAFLSITIVTFILTFVMPTFVGMFQSSGVELPLPTKILLSISSTIRTKWPIIILIILGIVFGLKYYFKTESGQLFTSKMKLKIPIVKGMNEKIIVTRFTRTLSTVLYSGITLIQGIQVVSKVIGNKVAEHKLLEVKDQLIKGIGLSEPLKDTGIFPPMLYSMVKIGEESGSLDDILDKTADFYDEELDAAVQQLTSILEPVMILIMGVIIGFIIISIALPMFDMANTVK
ncbi:type II secretion system F family protein [Clostridium aciditolerans]|uniref:Type II secretion system F family protein n=1 Tax=Clostridium aciditolerans TaxID=339861 RepID=A0A934I2K7_9CLOT|nr:type II secretion system F family protein [Clostridium aciditolerans]MBI6873866.1 type II secretion system F family protein [Clostridium aciditolerans]